MALGGEVRACLEGGGPALRCVRQRESIAPGPGHQAPAFGGGRLGGVLLAPSDAADFGDERGELRVGEEWDTLVRRAYKRRALACPQVF